MHCVRGLTMSLSHTPQGLHVEGMRYITIQRSAAQLPSCLAAQLSSCPAVRLVAPTAQHDRKMLCTPPHNLSKLPSYGRRHSRRCTRTPSARIRSRPGASSGSGSRRGMVTARALVMLRVRVRIIHPSICGWCVKVVVKTNRTPLVHALSPPKELFGIVSGVLLLGNIQFDPLNDATVLNKVPVRIVLVMNSRSEPDPNRGFTLVELTSILQPFLQQASTFNLNLALIQH